jgi:hypothetical protein
MAQHYVTFLRNHEVVHPATVLETHCADGTVVKIRDIPESRAFYTCGHTYVFKSKKSARAFVKAMDGAAKLV